MILKYILLIVILYIILTNVLVVIENYEIRNQDVNQEFANELKEREEIIEPTFENNVKQANNTNNETIDPDKFSKNNFYTTSTDNDYISQYSLINYTTLSKNDKEYEKMYEVDTKVFNHSLKVGVPKYLFYL